MIIFIVIIVLLIVGLNIQFLREPYLNLSPNNDVSWVQKDCNYIMNEILEKVLKDNNIRMSENNTKWNLYIPCSYNFINDEINKSKSENANNLPRYIYIIDNADEIVAKNYLWNNLKNKYGRNNAIKYMPETFEFSNIDEMKLFKQKYKNDKLYVLKKNIQRQLGLEITNNYDYIINNSNNFIVAQELINNPYLIYGRKINIRIYALIICHKKEIACYVFNDGFIYYTAEPFKKNSADLKYNVTTGYIDRVVYEYSPLTHFDLRKYLDSEKYLNKIRKLNRIEQDLKNKNIKISDHVFKNIYHLVSKCIYSSIDKMCGINKQNNDISFQLFGCDVALNDDLNAKMMEINKGPDLQGKDGRDYDLKYSLITDIFVLLKIIKKENNNFVKLFETNDNKFIFYY